MTDKQNFAKDINVPSKEQIMIDGVNVSGCRKKKLNKIVSYENYAEIHINSKTYGHYIALVDIEDLSNLVSKTWRVVKSKTSGKLYACTTNKNNSTIYMHSLIMNTPKGYDTDHINRENTLDNRKQNLRVVSRRQNLLNIREIKSNNTSGYKNITFNKQRQKWVVYFSIKGKTHYIGGFTDINEAIIARDKFKKSEVYNG